MNALASEWTTTTHSSSRPSPLLGVRPFIAKELQEWLRSWRAILLLLVTTPLMLINTMGPRIGETAARAKNQPIPPDLSFDSTTNIVVRWPEWIFMFAILFSIGLLISERDRGTLAWSLSKPLSRTGLLVGKWTAAMVMFSVFGIALPMAASVVAGVIGYGMPDLMAVAVATILLIATPAFYIALILALSTVVPSQAGVAGIAIGVALAPVLLGTLLPPLVDWFPSSISSWAVGMALGHPTSVITPIAWAIGTAAVAWLGARKLRAADL